MSAGGTFGAMAPTGPEASHPSARKGLAPEDSQTALADSQVPRDSQTALKDSKVISEYIPAGPRRGPLLALACIGQDWWLVSGGNNATQFAAVEYLTLLYNSPNEQDRRQIRQCHPGRFWFRPDTGEETGTATATTPVTVIKLPPEIVEHSPNLVFTREAERIVPSDYFTTKTGHFVSSNEVSLGMTIFEPLKRMCPQTYHEGERDYKHLLAAEVQRKKSSPMSCGGTLTQPRPLLGTL